MNRRKTLLYSTGFVALLVSALIHVVLLLTLILPEITPFGFKEMEKSPLKLLSIKNVGSEQGKKKIVKLELDKPDLKPPVKIKDLALKPHKEILPTLQKQEKITKKKNQLRVSRLNNVFSQRPLQEMNPFDPTKIKIEFEEPKGVSVDELNEFELVFYSFQKRVATKYVNSFMQEFQEYERHNPSKPFPGTKEKQLLSGQITYDHLGNIVRIQTKHWSNNKKLKEFFQEILKRMNKIQNPPKELTKKAPTFKLLYSLEII